MVRSRPPQSTSASASAKARAQGQVFARVQSAQWLKMSETQLAQSLEELENHPLFQKMLYPASSSWKILCFQPFRRTRLSQSFFDSDKLPLKESSPGEVSELISQNRDLLEKIRSIGQESFKRYFLDPQSPLGMKELEKATGLSPEEISRVHRFLLAYSVRTEFFEPSGLSSNAKPTLLLARTEVAQDGEIVFSWASPHMARGRYQIDYDRLKSLKSRPDLSLEEKKSLTELIQKLELVNWRKKTIFQILDLLCHTQKKYLTSRKPLDRRPLSQRQTARRLGLAPSTVNRAVSGRSLLLPWGEECFLTDLFYSRKAHYVAMLEWLDADTPLESLSDREIQKRLKDRWQVDVPRRTVNYYRRFVSL